jgi:hypothetical protein
LELAVSQLLWKTKDMSTQEMLLAEIKNQPEPVLREVWHYLKFLTRQREEEAWADVLPTRQVEQEVLNILDGHDSAPRRSLAGER